MLSKLNNQRGIAEFAILTAVSVVMWLLTIGVVKGVKKEQQPTVQVQEQQEKATQQQ